MAKFGAKVKELRFLVAQTAPSSSGIRDFISRYYLSLKVANPHVKFMIRESEGITPKIFARYEMGKEDCISVADNTADDIISKLKTLDQP
ncbi:NADH-ubiquinone oxidoreductase 10.5 kDa subunit [Schistosoma japonicum]|nr:NADH-ubiquinone oxidoreductase 10.5 kDa subunit [Schistosoma japonicum]KAH8877810.1 NADH-ubiquinone oxidoreductase 10.5 kDa subunit [Schistosoma japonicum]